MSGCSLTTDAELLPGAAVQALVEVEKASVLLDAYPVILMQPRTMGAVEVLAQAEAGHFVRCIPQGVDIEQGCVGRLVHIQPLPVGISGEVEAQRGCRRQRRVYSRGKKQRLHRQKQIINLKV